MQPTELIVIDVDVERIDFLPHPDQVLKAEVGRRLEEEITTRKLPKPLFVTGVDEGKVSCDWPGALRWCYVSKFTFYYEVTWAGEIVQKIYDSLTRKDTQ